MSSDIGSIYFGSMLLVLVLTMVFLDVKLPYDTLEITTKLLLVAIAILYLSPIIGRQLAKSQTLQKWYVAYNAKYGQVKGESL